MSRGLGRVQNSCLVVIWQYEREGELPTTYNIAAKVYHVKRDENGNRWISDAQHVAVKRALEGLQRQGKVIGFRTHRTRDPDNSDYSTELCHHWMSERRAQQWVRDELPQARGSWNVARIQHVMQKMRAIGMKVESLEQTGTKTVKLDRP